MYLLTIREGLATRYIGPYETPKHAADDLDRQLAHCDDRARWQIHELQSPMVSIGSDAGRAVPAPAA